MKRLEESTLKKKPDNKGYLPTTPNLTQQVIELNDRIDSLGSEVKSVEGILPDVNGDVNIQNPIVSATINTSNYVLTLKHLDNTNTLIDLPLEQMVVDVEYDNSTKDLIFTLNNGTVTNVPLDDIVSGLATTSYVDTKSNTKLDKIFGAGTYPIAYTRTESGSNNSTPLTDQNVANTLAYRDANGRFKVANPSVANDVANKGYVDNIVGDIETLLEAL